MGSDRTRALAVFGVIGAIAAAAGYYFFEVYRPDQVKRDAQAEVATWEQRWSSARGCLLGATPGSAKTSEALAIHELQPDPWDGGACTGLMSKLTRGDEPNTGLADVEAAWRTLDRAATKAAAAFAEHVTAARDLASDPLPDALDALDTAHANLRHAAGMTVEATHGPALPVAQQLALADGSDAVTQIDFSQLLPSAHGYTGFGKTTTGRDVQFSLPIGGAPSALRVGIGAARGEPDTSWVAAIDEAKLVVGPADPDGNVGNVGKPIQTGAKDVTSIAAVIGSLADGTVIYASGHTLGVARIKAGIATLEPTIEIADGYGVADTDGRVIATWTTTDKAGVTRGFARLFRPGSDSAAAAMDPDAEQEKCLASDRAWLSGERGLAMFDGTSVVTRADSDTKLLGCTADAAVLHDGDAYQVCTPQACRTTRLPAGAPKRSSVGIVDGKLVAVTLHGAVLGVWREGATAPAFYATPTQLTLAATMVTSDGKALDVPARSPRGIVVLRVPAH
ncbi:MAG TPA: hypothetical protein VGG28_08670 [Kofleriaceae bacterium]